MQKFRTFEECNYLKNDEERVLFLRALIEENDSKTLEYALMQVAKSQLFELLNAHKKTLAPALKSFEKLEFVPQNPPIPNQVP